MKYILTILSIIAAVSIATLVVVWPEKGPDDNDVVMTVNNHKFTSTMFTQSQRDRSSHHEDVDDFLDSVAFERVLIQEAQRLKIDKEPAFRDAIKNYYEQSLVKILLERKSLEIDDTVTDSEIESFLNCFGKQYTFKLALGNGPFLPAKLDWDSSSAQSERFGDLSSSLQPVMATMSVGQIKQVFDTGNDWFAIAVMEITEEKTDAPPPLPRDIVRNTIAAHKHGQELNKWINSLIDNANISISSNNLKE